MGFRLGMKTVLFLTVLTLGLVLGCTPAPEEKPVNEPTASVKANPGGPEASAKGSELSVNPAGKIEQPGGKTGH